MPIHNRDIAAAFKEIANLLDIQGANPFRIRAYRNAARAVADFSSSAAELVKNGEDLSQIPGIGKELAAKIREMVETGKLHFLEELKKEVPGELSDLMAIAGLGPKRIKTIYEKLQVSTFGELERAANERRISTLPGLGEKTEQAILEELKRVARTKNRIRLPVAEAIAESLVKYLKGMKGVKALDVAGSYRRRKETVGDLDILATVDKGTKIMDRFVGYEDVEKVISHGDTHSSVLLRSGFQVDLRVVPTAGYGAALHYFTGSKPHNIAIRKMGVKRGLKINEYGVFEDEKRIAGKTEAEVYATVGLPYIEPELREERGEIEAAQQNRLPELITVAEIRGDLHVHTKLTDGRDSLRAMAESAEKRGYEYIGITEHSRRVTVARGLDSGALRQQMHEIDALNGELRGITILKGIEVDILEDGELDLPDDVLSELDVVVC